MASPGVSVTAAAEQHSEGDTPVTESPATAPSKTDASSEIDTTCLSLPVGILVGPPSCPGVCCHKGNDWVRRHYDVERFPKDMGVEGLDTYAWKPLSGGIPNLARFLREYGLAPWKELPPVVRERMSLWSPVAQHLWESEFEEHQEALVRAWIWHYIDDNLLSFLEDDSSGEPLHCAAPVWSHVRALYRELDGRCLRFSPLLRPAKLRLINGGMVFSPSFRPAKCPPLGSRTPSRPVPLLEAPHRLTRSRGAGT